MAGIKRVYPLARTFLTLYSRIETNCRNALDICTAKNAIITRVFDATASGDAAFRVPRNPRWARLKLPSPNS